MSVKFVLRPIQKHMENVQEKDSAFQEGYGMLVWFPQNWALRGLGCRLEYRIDFPEIWTIPGLRAADWSLHITLVFLKFNF